MVYYLYFNSFFQIRTTAKISFFSRFSHVPPDMWTVHPNYTRAGMPYKNFLLHSVMKQLGLRESSGAVETFICVLSMKHVSQDVREVLRFLGEILSKYVLKKLLPVLVSAIMVHNPLLSRCAWLDFCSNPLICIVEVSKP